MTATLTIRDETPVGVATIKPSTLALPKPLLKLASM